MKVVYVAGPFRGKTPWDVELNIRHAEELALAVARAGAMPLCPHTMTRYFDRQCTDEFWLIGTLELLRRCDAIILTDTWEKSEGAAGEKKEALLKNMPIFYEESFDELVEWLET